MILVLLLVVSGNSPVSPTAMAVLGWLGLGMAVVVTCFAIALDRAWPDLRFLYVLPAWPLFSLLMSAVVAWAIVLEIRRAPAPWNKLTRTGVVSRDQTPVVTPPTKRPTRYCRRGAGAIDHGLRSSW